MLWAKLAAVTNLSISKSIVDDSPSSSRLPPRPVRPADLDEISPSKSRRGCLPIILAMAFLIVLGAVMMILSLGYLLPFLMIGGGLIVLIFGQYLLFGWLMERIYRNPQALRELEEQERENQKPPPPTKPFYGKD